MAELKRMMARALVWFEQNTNERFGWSGQHGNWFCTLTEKVEYWAGLKSLTWRAAMAELACLVCGEPAQHEADIYHHGWLLYCCTCFNHDWPNQRLIDGQQCGKVQTEERHDWSRKRRWVWRKEANDG